MSSNGENELNKKRSKNPRSLSSEAAPYTNTDQVLYPKSPSKYETGAQPNMNVTLNFNRLIS